MSKKSPIPFHLSCRPNTGPSMCSADFTSQIAKPSPYRLAEAPEARSSSIADHSGSVSGCCDSNQPFEPWASVVRRTKERCATAVPPRSQLLIWRAPVNGLTSVKGARNENSSAILKPGSAPGGGCWLLARPHQSDANRSRRMGQPDMQEVGRVRGDLKV